MAFSLEQNLDPSPETRGGFEADGRNRKVVAVWGMPAVSVHFDLHTPVSHRRARLEAYIADTYRSTYQARISQFYPLLLGMNITGETEAVVGLRPGFCRPMFLEHYLDLPIEQEIAALARCPVDRASLVEIGNLVSTRRGGSQLLFVVMAAALERAGYQWMVFTATPQVQKLVRRFNVELHDLANAEARQLGLQAEDWGSYYATRPKVMTCNIPKAMAVARGRRSMNILLENYRDAIDSLAKCLRDHRRLRGNRH